ATDGGEGDPANVVGNPANYWSVSADADEEVQELAIQYLNEYNLNDEMVDSFLEMGAIPAVEGLEEKFAGLDDEEFLSFAYDMVLEAPHFQLSWDQALAPAPAQELLTNLSQIFLQEIEPADFVTNMNATLASRRQRSPRLPPPPAPGRGRARPGRTSRPTRAGPPPARLVRAGPRTSACGPGRATGCWLRP